ncbi:MAG: hypothetical protein OQJ89_00390 [Kangiellaceae bacterium]|nr:hypothetical protein [Kangiellaceae bacterium]MCW9015397.1 hypothetical protein [Kangiellaceae bacterium]
MKIKNLLVGKAAALFLTLSSSAAMAAPSGVISINYYKTSAKQELIGYWYQSCYLSFKTMWGTRDGYPEYEAMHGRDCTQLGKGGNDAGSCMTINFDEYAHIGVSHNSGLNYYYVDRQVADIVRSDCSTLSSGL